MQLIKSLAAVSLFGVAVFSSVAVGGEDQYPAYNFQPSVLFSDPALIEKTSGSVAAVASHSQGTTSVHTAASDAVEDPKYPAAYFKPSVVYPAN